MANKIYGSTGGLSNEVVKIYASVGGLSDNVVKGYCSVDGLSKLFFGDEEIISRRTWVAKTWYGIDGSSIRGRNIWSDGTNIYLSNSWDYGAGQEYILDKLTSTWSKKTWNGDVPLINGRAVWSDGNNIYYDYDNYSRVLDRNTSTWNNNVWNYSEGTPSQRINGENIWTDGTDIYYSYSDYGAEDANLILDKDTRTWSEIVFNGFNDVTGANIWTDGVNIYYSTGYTTFGANYKNYIFDKNTKTWSTKTWYGIASGASFYGGEVWKERKNIYYSHGGAGEERVLNKATSTWSSMSWIGLPSNAPFGIDIWSDGNNTYYSTAINNGQYVLTGDDIQYAFDGNYTDNSTYTLTATMDVKKFISDTIRLFVDKNKITRPNQGCLIQLERNISTILNYFMQYKGNSTGVAVSIYGGWAGTTLASVNVQVQFENSPKTVRVGTKKTENGYSYYGDTVPSIASYSSAGGKNYCEVVVSNNGIDHYTHNDTGMNVTVFGINLKKYEFNPDSWSVVASNFGIHYT